MVRIRVRVVERLGLGFGNGLVTATLTSQFAPMALMKTSSMGMLTSN